MALDLTSLADDHDFMVADLPSTLVFGTQTVSCTKATVNRGDAQQFEGVFENRDLEVAVKISAFTGSIIPDVGELITVDNVQFRVESSTQDAAAVGAVLQVMRV